MDNVSVPQKPFRILVVDDEQSIRSVLSQVLIEDGHEVTSAASAEEALEIFRQRPFPLVLTDIVMSKMSGIELLEEIKKINADTEVIIMTSYVSLDSAITALRIGAYDYLTKPVDNISIISQTVGRALDKIRLKEENHALLETLRVKNAELEQHNVMLKDLAIRDGLTGLFNHRHFQEALAIELVRAKRYNRSLSLIFIDVDSFKQYNDTHGHPEGDKVLVMLANLFPESLRTSDTIARYGGEEFVLLLPETTKESALRVAEHIRKNVFDCPFPHRDTQPAGRITISLGVATFPDDGADGSSLIARADMALYQAKQSGRNRVC